MFFLAPMWKLRHLLTLQRLKRYDNLWRACMTRTSSKHMWKGVFCSSVSAQQLDNLNSWMCVKGEIWKTEPMALVRQLNWVVGRCSFVFPAGKKDVCELCVVWGITYKISSVLLPKKNNTVNNFVISDSTLLSQPHATYWFIPVLRA